MVAPAYPHLTIQPSEFVPETPAPPEQQWSKHGKIGLRLGLDELACIDEHGCKVFKNVLPAVALDLSKPWPAAVTDKAGSFSLIMISNTLHITPWACSEGLFRGAGEVLAPGGHLIIYGPFKGKKFVQKWCMWRVCVRARVCVCARANARLCACM